MYTLENDSNKEVETKFEEKERYVEEDDARDNDGAENEAFGVRRVRCSEMDGSWEDSNAGDEEFEANDDDDYDTNAADRAGVRVDEKEEEEDIWASGPCKNLNDCAERHSFPNEEKKILRRLGRDYEKGCNQMARREMLWVQLRTLELIEKRKQNGQSRPLAFFSDMHAGHGQALWGNGFKQRADLTIVPEPGQIQIFNFHGGYYHYKGHTSTCFEGQKNPVFTPFRTGLKNFRAGRV